MQIHVVLTNSAWSLSPVGALFLTCLERGKCFRCLDVVDITARVTDALQAVSIVVSEKDQKELRLRGQWTGQ